MSTYQMNNNAGAAQGGFPVHPGVQLKRLPFYDNLAVLIKPSTLIPSTSQRLQENSFFFHLTPTQATDIAMNRDMRSAAKLEHTIQVQLRFCVLETGAAQEDYFPPSVLVKINGKPCQLPNPIPTNKPGVEAKRPPRPVNVTPLVKLSPTVSNSVQVSWAVEFGKNFCVSAYLVRKLNSAQLLERLRAKGVQAITHTKSVIVEKLQEDADCDIATTMLKVSLMCPLGKMRMTTPCRSSTCLHLQCFDANLFLLMNERKPTWNCPVCDKAANYDNLVIDGYFQDVLQSPLLSSDDHEIQLHKDGSWSTHVEKNGACSVESPQKPVCATKTESVSVVDLDDTIETPTSQHSVQSNMLKMCLRPAGGDANGGGGVADTNGSEQPTNDTVDLTLSDSDEDMPQRPGPKSRQGKK